MRLAELKVPQGKPYQIPTQFGLLMRSLSPCSAFFVQIFPTTLLIEVEFEAVDSLSSDSRN